MPTIDSRDLKLFDGFKDFYPVPNQHKTSNASSIESYADGQMRDRLIFRFLKRHGYAPNLLSPNTFSEKLLHKMLFDRRPILTMFADKLAVRHYVEQRLGGKEHLATIHCVFARANDLYSFCFPSRFVLKANHGSGWNYIHYGGEFNRVRLVQVSRRWLQSNFGLVMDEWCYNDIKPRVFCEEYLGIDHASPVDYKFYCFSGIARFIEAHFDRHLCHKCNIFDRDWNLLDVRLLSPWKPDARVTPKNLAQMISIADRLSEGIDFVRVDLYDLGDRVVFGEMTNYPTAARARFEPQEWDAIFGSYWRRMESAAGDCVTNARG